MHHPQLAANTAVDFLIQATSLTTAASPVAPTSGAQIVDLKGRLGKAICVLSSNAGTGTTPTLNVKLQHSSTADFSADVNDIAGAAFVEVDDTAGGSHQEIEVNLHGLKRYLRAHATIVGTSGDFEAACILISGGMIELPMA